MIAVLMIPVWVALFVIVLICAALAPLWRRATEKK
jgi:hypothetical protein